MKALALVSGGLDSMLAAKVIKDQGIEVVALVFSTRFGQLTKPPAEAPFERIRRTMAGFGIEARSVDIGDDFLAHSQTVVREGCAIGHRVILQNGVVIGGDGFGFAKRSDGHWHKIMQQAPVVIEDDVEIQANSCIDRATVGETRIRRGAKIDDLVLVGHACEIGEDAILCGQVGLAGSTRVGNRAILAGQVGSAGHLDIGDGAIITSQSGMHLDVPPGAVRSGSPVMENKLWLKVIAAMKRLPEMQKTLRHLAAEIEQRKGQEK